MPKSMLIVNLQVVAVERSFPPEYSPVPEKAEDLQHGAEVGEPHTPRTACNETDGDFGYKRREACTTVSSYGRPIDRSMLGACVGDALPRDDEIRDPYGMLPLPSPSPWSLGRPGPVVSDGSP